jgi:hypothetical protein
MLGRENTKHTQLKWRIHWEVTLNQPLKKDGTEIYHEANNKKKKDNNNDVHKDTKDKVCTAAVSPNNKYFLMMPHVRSKHVATISNVRN